MAPWCMSPKPPPLKPASTLKSSTFVHFCLPLDLETIEASVRKTGRCVIVHEATLTSGFGAELDALVQETCFYHLEAPIVRVAGWDAPYPHAQEWDYFPGPDRVGRALLETMAA